MLGDSDHSGNGVAAATSFGVRMQNVGFGCDKKAYSKRTPQHRERSGHHSCACSITTLTI